MTDTLSSLSEQAVEAVERPEPRVDEQRPGGRDPRPPDTDLTDLDVSVIGDAEEQLRLRLAERLLSDPQTADDLVTLHGLVAARRALSGLPSTDGRALLAFTTQIRPTDDATEITTFSGPDGGTPGKVTSTRTSGYEINFWIFKVHDNQTVTTETTTGGGNGGQPDGGGGGDGGRPDHRQREPLPKFEPVFP